MNQYKGNVLDIVENLGGVLLHQVNCQRKAGAGIALQIHQRWPRWYNHYFNHRGFLGHALLTPVQLEPPVLIGSLYAQDGYGRDRQYTDYTAFETALRSLVGALEGYVVYAPYLIGCGNGGGKWPVIVEIFERVLPTVVFIHREDV